MERFWSKVDIKNKNDCWNWIGAIDTNGYGAFKYMGKKINSHRFAWFLENDYFSEINICHICDNRLCCNPNHLFEGTGKDNMQDAKNKNRLATSKNKKHGFFIHPEKVARGENSGKHILTNENVIKIKFLLKNTNYKHKEIGKIFGVARSTISCIAINRNWKSIK